MEQPQPNQPEPGQPGWRLEKKRHGGKGRKFGYIVVIAIHFFLFWFVNKIPDWNWTFITYQFEEILPYLNFSIFANIIVNAFFLINDVRPIYYLGKTVVDAIGIFVMYKLYVVFPLDFDNALDIIFKAIFIIGIVGSAIGIIVRTIKYAVGKKMD
ncbi:MAG: hypothetical protein ABIB97_04565 [Patescibacteria group bacterium]